MFAYQRGLWRYTCTIVDAPASCQAPPAKLGRTTPRVREVKSTVHRWYRGAGRKARLHESVAKRCPPVKGMVVCLSTQYARHLCHIRPSCNHVRVSSIDARAGARPSFGADPSAPRTPATRPAPARRSPRRARAGRRPLPSSPRARP